MFPDSPESHSELNPQDPNRPEEAGNEEAGDEEAFDADEAPRRIAILGAGPMGLEAALYARFLGYEVTVFERGRIAEHVQQWGHVQMFSPFGMNSSPLGRSALAAQCEGYEPPALDAFLTGHEWIERYLLPLAQSDLVAPALREECEVLAVGRAGQLKTEHVGQPARGATPLVVLFRTAGGERTAAFDVVLDCTGVYRSANWCGPGGMPARGEGAARPHLITHLPNVLGAQQATFANRRVLVVGGGYSAATCVVALARLAREANAASTSIAWVTRAPRGEGQGPISLFPSDRLPERDRLAKLANALAHDPAGGVFHRGGTWLETITYLPESDSFSITLAHAPEQEELYDRVIALVGYRGDRSLHEELQVHECYASGAPLKLAASLLARRAQAAGPVDCLAQPSCGPSVLANPEPDFYILGAKSYGRDSSFLVRQGLEQVRDVFTLIQGRANLDLYAQFARLQA